jgi:fatty-acid peroxygenase
MPVPRDPAIDATVSLLREGYTFVTSRAERYGTDAFRARMMLQEVVFAVGAEAATVFYEPGRMTRVGALPPTTLRLLQDRGSVSLLDGDMHHCRKDMFLSVLSHDASHRLADVFEDEWRRAVPVWARRGPVVLHQEVREVLCRSVCAWAGVPLADEEVVDMARHLGALVDGAGSVGPRNWVGFAHRWVAERWAREVVGAVRDDRFDPGADSAVAAVARHRDADGASLPLDVAAVELLNVLRPTVAVARFVTFAALALHQHRDQRPDPADDHQVERYVQEVRRTSPFFPVVGGRAIESFDWRSHHFAQGSWMLLDLWGTNHDPDLWPEPQAFRPDRFRDRHVTPFDLVPQGGGDQRLSHRCAGEWATIELMKRAVRLLLGMRYEVPDQDLTVDLRRMPALPASGFLIDRVRA